MANQQLIDYIKGQMMAGVSESDIRKILKDAGWPDADIEDGVKGAKPGLLLRQAVLLPVRRQSLKSRRKLNQKRRQ